LELQKYFRSPGAEYPSYTTGLYRAFDQREKDWMTIYKCTLYPLSNASLTGKEREKRFYCLNVIKEGEVVVGADTPRR